MWEWCSFISPGLSRKTILNYMTKDLKTSLPLLNFRWHVDFSLPLQYILRFVTLTCLLEKRHVLAPPITKSAVSASFFFTKKLNHQAAKLVGYYSYCLDPRSIAITTPVKRSVNYYRFHPFFLCVCVYVCVCVCARVCTMVHIYLHCLFFQVECKIFFLEIA